MRKAHNSGRNHIQNVIDYYSSESFVADQFTRRDLTRHPPPGLGHNEAQSIIDQITRQYEGHGPMGGSVMRNAGPPFMPPMGKFPTLWRSPELLMIDHAFLSGGFRPPMMQGGMGMMPPGNFARPPQFVPPGQGPPQGFGGPPGGFPGAPPPAMGMPPGMPQGMPPSMPPQGFTPAPPGGANGRPPAINPERMRMMGRG